jgi:hypothetical protein
VPASANLVTDVAPGTARDATIAVLTHLRAHARGAHAAAVWREAVETLSGVRVTPHDLVHLEDAAFGLAAPEPLIMTETAPRRVRDIEAVGAAGPRSESDAPHGALWHAVARHIDVDLADAVSRVTTRIWRRVRSDGSPRRAGRAPWLVGAGTAAAVLAAGLLWPAGGGVATADAPGLEQTSRADESGAAPTSHTPTPSPDRPGASEDLAFEPGSGAQPGDSAERDITAIADELLERRRACGAESACLGETQLDPAAALTGGAIDLARPERRVVLLDDFGGAAVLRIDPVDTTVSSQLVVIVRLNDEWLLRDVHDVAQQP